MKLREVVSKEALQHRVRELAEEIDAFYSGEDLVVVCVLKGGFAFFSDLVQAMTKDVLVDFVRLSKRVEDGYRHHVEIHKDLEVSLENRHVLIVEDVLDSGRSMDFLMRYFSSRGALSIRLAVLLDRHKSRAVPIFPDFVGFDIPPGFIVGYGLDHAERFRTLSALYEICED